MRATEHGLTLAARVLTLNFVGRYLDEISKGPQRRRHKPPSGVIEIRPRETLPPGFEDRLKRAAFKVWAQPVLEQRHDAGVRDRGVDEENGSIGTISVSWLLVPRPSP